MALSPYYFASIGLEDYLVDPTSGEPLANGWISSYVDTQRTTAKTLFQLSGNPPDYTYSSLPNPVPLTATGNPSNANGDQVKLYYYPFDADGNLELYFLEIYNSSGVKVYEIQAMPDITELDNPSTNTNIYENQLSNPQFVEVSFNQDIGFALNITTTVSEQEYEIAPDWFIRVSTNGEANLTIDQVAIEGALAIPTNPPFVLEIQASGDFTSIELIQRLKNNPDIWSSTTDNTGYVAGFLLTSSLDGLAHTITMEYSPSVASASQLILTGSTGISGYKQLYGTVELTSGVNSQDGNDGYVDIVIDIPNSCHINLSSVQVVGLLTEVTNVPYSQETSNRQRDHLFNYYEEPLKYKPIQSYLVGWDFPLNPAQFGESGSLGSLGANTSAYIWDQTIAFQSVTNSVSYQRGAQAVRSGLQISTTEDTQIALIQYMPMNSVADILNTPLSVNINIASTPSTADKMGTVSLWYCTDSTLPDLNSYESIVSSLNDDGSVNSTNGNWVEIPLENSINATFILPGSGNGFFYDFSFNNFVIDDSGIFEDANFFAIVVGFEEVPASSSFYFESISLVPGTIATRPAPQSQSEVLLDCQYYYAKSYDSIDNVGSSGTGGELLFPQYVSNFSTIYSLRLKDFQIVFPTEMYEDPDIYFWPPSLATITEGSVTVQIIYYGTLLTATYGTNPENITVSGNFSLYSLSRKQAYYRATQSDVIISGELNPTQEGVQAQMILQYAAGARLGLESGV